jgi:uncharacterized repeat protein (TIGR02543 family)
MYYAITLIVVVLPDLILTKIAQSKMKSRKFLLGHRVTGSLMLAVALALLLGCSNNDKETDEKLTVSFDLGYTGAKNEPGPFTVKSGETLGSQFPPNPEREGEYSFEGWYTSAGIEFTADTVIMRNITVTARWEQAPRRKPGYSTGLP